jgi:rhamnosyltransferase subunit B
MKVLLLTIGSHGDVHPFVGMGVELRRRGHEATLITNGYFRRLAESAGVGFVELGTQEQFRALIKDPDLWHPRRSFDAVFLRGVLPILEQAYRSIVDHYVPGETVVVASVLGFGARIAQEKFGIPTASAHTAPSILRTIYDVPKLPGLYMPKWYPLWLKRSMWWIADTLLIDRALGPPINEFRATLGLNKPASGFMKDWWNSPDLVIGLWPDWYAPPQPDWPPQFSAAGFPLYDETGITPISDELDAWLRAGSPPIAFTPGSAMAQGRKFFLESAQACERLNRRGLLLTRHPEQIPASLPAGVRHVDYAPFGQLLPRCAALVHHGGIGTTAQALRSGTPQLIMAMAHDQFDNANRVQRLGVGSSIGVRRYRAPRVATLLHELIDSADVAARCREVARRFEGVDAIGTACDLVEELFATRSKNLSNPALANELTSPR